MSKMSVEGSSPSGVTNFFHLRMVVGLTLYFLLVLEYPNSSISFDRIDLFGRSFLVLDYIYLSNILS